MVGIANVEKIENEMCEPTNRVGGQGLPNDPMLEYSSVVEIDRTGLTEKQLYNLPMCGGYLTMIYEIDNATEQEAIDNDCDVWDLAHVNYNTDYRIG